MDNSSPDTATDGAAFATVTEPPQLRFLRLLVTVLTGVMILGLLTLVVLFVMRFQNFSTTSTPMLPDQITLPEGVTAQAVTAASDWFAVVTDTNEILIFDTDGALIQQVTITTDKSRN